MKIHQNDIQVNDEVQLTLGKSRAEGPVVRRQTNEAGKVVAVWLPAFESSFWLSPEAVNVEEWGRPVWTVVDVERPEAQQGVIITAETDGGHRRRVFGTTGVHHDGFVYPYVDEFGNLLKHDELRNVEVEPDWKAAVDVYARMLHDARAVVAGLRLLPASKAKLEEALTAVVEPIATTLPPGVSLRELNDVVRRLLGSVPAGVDPMMVANLLVQALDSFLERNGVKVAKPL